MAGEWKTVRLGDLTTWASGGTPSKANPDFWNGDIPWISASSMKTPLLCDSDLKITKAGLENGSRLAETNSILLLVRGSELHKRIPVGVATRPVAFNQDVKALKVRGEMLSEYLFYWLLGNETMLLGKVEHTGIGAGKLDTEVLKNLPIPLPPLAEQKAIAAVLGALDDKIELNRRMNATLEAMARALFQSWFVDFDPVRRNKEEGGRMNDEISALFPDSFQESALGLIPKGWEVCPLSSRTRYLSRGIGPSYLKEGGVCVLNQKCVRDHRVDFSKSRRHDADKKPFNDRALQLHDILVNSTGMGTLGRVAQVLNLPEVTIADSHVTIVRADSHTDPYFLGINLTCREAEIEELGEGSTGQTELSRARLGQLKIITPPSELQKAFGVVVAPLLARISENDHQSRTLAALRDTLLPKLLSGELSVAGTDT